LRRLALTIPLMLAFATAAPAFVGPEQRSGDLDGDGDAETVRAARVDLPRIDDQFDQTDIRVSDSCGGQALDQRVAGPQENLALLKLKAADTRPGLEIFSDLRAGAAGRVGEADLVAWRPAQGFPCRVPRRLFHYESANPTRAPKGASGGVGSFLVSLRDKTRRYRGLELTLDERFLGARDPACCPRTRKVTRWRYSRARDRYIRYQTRVKRIRRR
jgi:hypothetical protein